MDSVFKSIDLLSKEARDSIKDAVGPIDGFRPGKDVPKGMLRAECHKLSKKLNFFSMVIMPVWAEANPDLLKLVSNHMNGCPPPNADKKALDDYSSEQVETLARQHDQYDREDLLIMVRYCAADTDSSLFGESDPGRNDSPYRSPGDRDNPIPLVARILYPCRRRRVGRTRAPIRFRPHGPDLPQGRGAFRRRKASRIGPHRLQGRSTPNALGFFQADTSDWAPAKIAWVDSQDALQQQAASLGQALEEYSQADRRGNNLTEERNLREQRDQLEKAIESRIKRINELLQDANPPEQDHRRTTLQEFLDDLNALVEDDADVPDAGPERQAGSDALSNAGETERALEEQLAGLEKENRELQRELRRLQQQVTLWRSNYETERRSKDDSEPDPIPTEFTSVAHVLEIAERRFADRLVFKFNSASDPDYPYDTPADVWNALEWLATAYYDSHTGKISIPNLSDSLREVSRFRYTPHQSGTTIGMYPDSYYTRINGHKVLLKEHMGAGIDRSPTNSIRIAFNWDKQSGKVIVGYIGLHQHNRKT